MNLDIILNEIKKIDWSTIKNQCGYCTHIPMAFPNLVDLDANIRMHAYWNFDNDVVVQSNLYEGAFYVVPFVIQLLKNNINENRDHEELYDLLFEIGNGFGKGLVEFEIRTQPFVYYVPKKGGILWTLTEACKEAVFSGWDIYYNDLMNTSSKNRKEALDLIGLFNNHIIIQKTVMQKIVDMEPNSELGMVAKSYLDEVYYP